MGYIKKDSVAYVSAKLTDYGREKLALGRLNFSYWGFGDSEMDYGTFSDKYSWLNNGAGGNVDLGLLNMLRPADNPPGHRYPLLRVPGNSGSSYTSMSTPEVLKTIINNQAVTRGFITGATKDAVSYPERKYDSFIQSGTSYTKAVGKTNLASIVRAGSNVVKSNVPGTTGIDINLGQTGAITDVSVNAVEPVAGDFMLLVPNSFALYPNTITPNPAVFVSNGTTGPGTIDSSQGTPFLWYRIVEVTGTLAANSLKVTVDRSIPNFTGSTTTQYRDSHVFFYDGGGVNHNPIDTYYGTGTTIPYWNELSLSFDSNCDVSVNDVKVWNMNIPWTETVAGLTASTHGTMANFGSTAYTSTKEYLEYTKPVFSESLGGIADDYRQKSIAVIHYTNNSISNFYGEGFYWSDTGVNNFQLTLPTVMYNYTGNTTIGLLLTGETRVTPRSLVSTYNSNSEVNYYQLHTSGGTSNTTLGGLLIENYTAPVSVGKIFPDLKIAVIDDEEIVAALSYKSNRNWVLPQLKAEYASVTGSTSAEGISQAGDQFWITYQFTSTSGYTSGMYCNKYTFLSMEATNCDNCDGANKNIKLTFPYGSLPFMRRNGIAAESGGPNNEKYLGWEATGFDVLIQKTQNNEPPTSTGWKRIPIAQNAAGTSILNSFTDGGGGTDMFVDYEVLYNGEFVITKEFFDNCVITATDPYTPDFGLFSLNDWIHMPIVTEMTDSTPTPTLTFGDERWMYGNVDTDIKATVFRTTFMFSAAGTDFNTSQNPTWGTGVADPSHNVRISEVSVYDSNFREVIVGKISDPIEKKQDSQFTLAMGLDF